MNHKGDIIYLSNHFFSKKNENNFEKEIKEVNQTKLIKNYKDLKNLYATVKTEEDSENANKEISNWILVLSDFSFDEDDGVIEYAEKEEDGSKTYYEIEDDHAFFMLFDFCNENGVYSEQVWEYLANKDDVYKLGKSFEKEQQHWYNEGKYLKLL